MLVQQPFEGPSEGYRVPRPGATMAAKRALLARSLALLGLSRGEFAASLSATRSSIDDAPKVAEPEVDPSLPPEVPPAIEPPPPRVRPALVNLSEQFIGGLRAEYTRTGDPRTRRIGRLDDVQAWLDGLKPGQVPPRATP